MNDDVTYLCSVGVIRSKDSAEISNTKKVVVEILKTTQKKGLERSLNSSLSYEQATLSFFLPMACLN